MPLRLYLVFVAGIALSVGLILSWPRAETAVPPMPSSLIGKTEDEVKATMGEPIRVIQSPSGPVYNYSSPRDEDPLMLVYFDNEGRVRKVESGHGGAN
jgi:hypothetical protein